MIEVFRTNVTDATHAADIIRQLELAFPGYEANFDLDDCDHVLRVKSPHTAVDADAVRSFLATFGLTAEVLPDTIPSFLHTN